jgi:hypothetical protein
MPRLTSRRTVAIAALVVAAAAVAVAFFGWRRTGSLPGGSSAKQRSADLTRRLEQLKSVPYTSVGREDVSGAPSGVVVYDRARAEDGYNLYVSRVSPEAFLMDMEGKIVHRWTYPEQRARQFVWSHAVMLANGDLLVLNQFKDLKRLDWESNLIWKREMAADHDVIELPDHTIYVIELEMRQHRGLQLRCPVIVHLTGDGEELDRWSAYEHLDDLKRALDRRSFLDTILDSLAARGEDPRPTEAVPGRMEIEKVKGEIVYDYFHLNTVSVLPDTQLGRRDARFAAGNLLVCFRNVNQIAVLDAATKAVTWAWGEGTLEWPHHPTMLENGDILLFDNGSRRGFSRLLEVNPESGRVAWEYTANPPQAFYTYEKGSAQRLANGNTLVCQGDEGRAFEITRDGEIVWDWYNPQVKRGRRVQIYRVIRMPAPMVKPLLAGASWGLR